MMVSITATFRAGSPIQNPRKEVRVINVPGNPFAGHRRGHMAAMTYAQANFPGAVSYEIKPVKMELT